MRRTARHVVVDFAELSDPGRDPQKQVNEDATGYAATPFGHLAVVCDGMGGHEGGRAASERAVHSILTAIAASAPSGVAPVVLGAAIRAAGAAVHALGGDAPAAARPGATCVAIIVAEAGATVAHVGDSRALLVRAGAVERLTRDHSLVEEMVAAGVLEPERAAHHPEANKITRALGMAPTVDVEVRAGVVALEVGDVLLLTSDGVTDLVSDSDLAGIVASRANLGAAVVCQEIIALANARGGHDNATVQVLEILELPPAPARDTVMLEPYDRQTEPVLPHPLGEVEATRPSPDPWRAVPLTAAGAPRPRALHMAAPTLVDDPVATLTATRPDLGRVPTSTTGAGHPPVAMREPGARRRLAPKLLLAALALLVGISAVVWLRHLRAVETGEEPPALVVESAPSNAQPITSLSAALDPPSPAAAAASSAAIGQEAAPSADSAPVIPTGSAVPSGI